MCQNLKTSQECQPSSSLRVVLSWEPRDHRRSDLISPYSHHPFSGLLRLLWGLYPLSKTCYSSRYPPINGDVKKFLLHRLIYFRESRRLVDYLYLFGSTLWRKGSWKIDRDGFTSSFSSSRSSGRISLPSLLVLYLSFFGDFIGVPVHQLLEKSCLYRLQFNLQHPNNIIVDVGVRFSCSCSRNVSV